MKLYRFVFSNYLHHRFLMEEIDAEEKSRIYITERREWINKDVVGRASGYGNNECILLENNPSKASKILLSQRENELKRAEEKVAEKKSEIEFLKTYIKED